MISPRFGSSTTTGALDDRAGAEDADLRLVDDRGVEQRAPAAGVGQRERAAGELVRADLVGPGPLGHVGDPPRQPGEVEVTGVADDRHDQPPLGVHGDAQVLGVVVGDRAGSVSIDALTFGCAAAPRPWPARRTAGTTASRRAWRGSRPWPRRAARAIRVTSTSTTVVSCAEICSDSTIRCAMSARSRDSFSVRPRSGLGSTLGRGRPQPAAAGSGCAGGRACRASAAASTSCLRIRPPTPVPVTVGQVDAVLGGELAHQRGDVGRRRRRRRSAPGSARLCARRPARRRLQAAGAGAGRSRGPLAARPGSGAGVGAFGWLRGFGSVRGPAPRAAPSAPITASSAPTSAVSSSATRIS